MLGHTTGVTDVTQGLHSVDDGQGGPVQIETSEGPLEIRFTYEDAERLITGLHAARGKIQTERAHSAQPPIPEVPKTGERFETALDPVLEQAAKRFDASTDMRQ